MLKSILTKLILLCVLIVLIAGLLWWRFLVTPITGPKEVHYVLKPGTTAIRFAYEIEKTTALTQPHWLLALIKWRGDVHRLRHGEYLFTPYSTPGQLLDQVVRGSDVYHVFTIVNGWTINQVLSVLAADPSVTHTLKGEPLKAIAQQLNIPHASPEGCLFPDTYFYTWGTPDIVLLQRAAQEMQDYLQQTWPSRQANLPYRNTYQVLTVASMVEKETALPEEMPIIAAVILKRLTGWMHLQIDATVIYGLGADFKGPLTRADLRRNTPYNSYLHYGLPPTPIAMPGALAIQAALHPAQVDFLYYVSKGDGSHQFSKTLDEHRAAIKKYLLNTAQ